MNGMKKHGVFALIGLLVLLILAVLASIVSPGLVGRPKPTSRIGTIADIQWLKSALGHFEVDNGRYPTTEEGLAALTESPVGLESSWGGPYLEKLTTDKWGKAYMYVCPGAGDPLSYDLASAGRDGTLGTDDDIDKYTEH